MKLTAADHELLARHGLQARPTARGWQVHVPEVGHDEPAARVLQRLRAEGTR